MAEQPLKEGYEWQYWVCTGLYANSQNKPYITLLRCEHVEGEGWLLFPGDENKAVFAADRKIKAKFNRGSIYKIQVNGSSFLIGYAQFENIWPDQQQRQAWAAVSRTHELDIEDAKRSE